MRSVALLPTTEASPVAKAYTGAGPRNDPGFAVGTLDGTGATWMATPSISGTKTKQSLEIGLWLLSSNKAENGVLAPKWLQPQRLHVCTLPSTEQVQRSIVPPNPHVQGLPVTIKSPAVATASFTFNEGPHPALLVSGLQCLPKSNYARLAEGLPRIYSYSPNADLTRSGPGKWQYLQDARCSDYDGVNPDHQPKYDNDDRLGDDDRHLGDDGVTSTDDDISDAANGNGDDDIVKRTARSCVLHLARIQSWTCNHSSTCRFDMIAFIVRHAGST
jgi:hypothetical protein